jgi:hypothetical protein
MKALAFGTALAIAGSLSIPGIAVAKGSGGHSGGGHSGGGHSGGGHAGGHASPGHGGGQTHGSSGPHAGAGGHGHAATPTTPASANHPALPRNGQAPTTFLPPVSPAHTPYRIWPYYPGGIGFAGVDPYVVYDPFWLGYQGDAYGVTGSYPGYGVAVDAPSPVDAHGPAGGLRLKIQPKDAQVYVDGYYAGVVDDFNGHFQHLELVPGPHHVEVLTPGRQSLEFDVVIQSRHTTVYEGTLAPLAP